MPQLTIDEVREEIEIRLRLEKLERERKILTYFPDAGPLRRELYPKHLEFFRAGNQYRERLMLAANRVGKTEGVGGYELALHLTGWYPDWWEGRRFYRPIRAWACGDTGTTVRDIIQGKLFGPPSAQGTGLIPGECIARTTRAPGRADAIDTAYIRSRSGGESVISLKTYEQGRESFQGTEQDIIWEDEEPPLDVHIECLMRTMTNNGMVMMTFTPLLGMSEVVLQFLPGGKLTDVAADSTKYVVMATWDDAPHLTEEAKKELWASIPPFQRDARSKGVPQLGAGAIYPVPESDLLVEPFVIPPFWPQGYGMDVGWNCTAAVFGALDKDHGTLYLTDEYKRNQSEPAIHTAAIKARGDWLPGFIDPASRGRGQKDGSQLLTDYRQLGLKLQLADNGVESGLYSVWNRMSTGRLKVFRNMQNWLAEFRLYRRDERGRVVKENDHLMDATRYLDSRIHQMIVKPPPVSAMKSPMPMRVWG
jgi:phage terminase large subunit-like protein